jgi:hypothetical protein
MDSRNFNPNPAPHRTRLGVVRGRDGMILADLDDPREALEADRELSRQSFKLGYGRAINGLNPLGGLHRTPAFDVHAYVEGYTAGVNRKRKTKLTADEVFLGWGGNPAKGGVLRG